MDKLAIWAYLEAKPGKEREVEEFLKSAQPLAEKEAGTIVVVRSEDRSVAVRNFRYVR